MDIYPYALTLHEMISLKIPHFNTAEEDYGESMGDNDNSQSESSYDEHAFDEALGRQLGNLSIYFILKLLLTVLSRAHTRLSVFEPTVKKILLS